MIDKNPYRTLHARMSPPGAAWDEGFAAGQSQAWDSAQVEIDAILASEARPASVGRVVAFLREPRDSTDVNLSLAVAADLIEREFAAGRAAATPDPDEQVEAQIAAYHWGQVHGAAAAASPDERLREALREIVDTAPGIDRWTIDRRLDDEQWTGKVAVEVVRASSVDVMVAALRAALAAADREKPDLPPGVRCRPGFAPPVPDEPKEKP